MDVAATVETLLRALADQSGRIVRITTTLEILPSPSNAAAAQGTAAGAGTGFPGAGLDGAGHDVLTSRQLLIDAGISDDALVADFARRFPPERIRQCLDAMKMSRKAIVSPAGFLRRALENNWFRTPRSLARRGSRGRS